MTNSTFYDNNSNNITTNDNIYVCPSEIVTVYLTPAISFFGILFNLFSTIVFTRMIQRNRSINILYKILYIKSILVLFMYVLNVFMPIYYCKSCSISSSLVAQVWFIYFFNYAEDFLLTSSLVFEIMAALQCYFNLTSKGQTRQLLCLKASSLSMFWIVLIVLGLSMLWSSLILFRFQIVNDNKADNSSSNNHYRIETTDYFNSSTDRFIRFVQIFIRDIISVIVLLAIQAVLIVFIQKRVEAKQNFTNLTQQQSSPVSLERCKQKTILMVVSSGLIYVIGHIPLLLYYLPFYKYNQEFWSCYYVISLVPFYFSFLPHFIIYSFFNKIFSKHLKEILGLK